MRGQQYLVNRNRNNAISAFDISAFDSVFAYDIEHFSIQRTEYREFVILSQVGKTVP